MSNMIIDHPFNHLGQAPFRVVGFREIVIKHGDGSTQAGGTCEHCGTGIRYASIIQDANGREFKVGSECVKKTGDAKLVKEVIFRKHALDRQKREEKREAERLAHLDAQREKNHGLTDWELREWQSYADELTTLHENAPVIAILKPLAEKLRDGRGGFCDDVADGLERGELPKGRGLEIMVDILAKQAGRGGSKAYEVENDRIWDIIESVE